MLMSSLVSNFFIDHQVKLSVLKEEKRLLMLQLKAKSSQLGRRSIGVGDNSPLDLLVKNESELKPRVPEKEVVEISPMRPTSREADQAHLLSFVSSLDTVLNGAFSDITTEHPSQKIEHSKALVRIQKTVGVGCYVPTKSIGVGDGRAIQPPTSEVICSKCQGRHGKSSDSEPEHRLIPRAKLQSCSKCIERSRRRFESKETATEPQGKRDVLRKLEQLTFDVCEPTSVKPEPRPCSRCEERLQHVTADSSTNTDTVRVSSVGVMVRTRSSTPSVSPSTTTATALSPTPRPRSRSQGAQTQRVSTGNMGVQISPTPVRKRDINLQADVVERRHVGVQILAGDLKVATASVGTGVANVWETVCDRCRGLRRRSIGVGSHVTQRDVGVAYAYFAETTSRGCGDCAVSDVLCERCELRQTETVGVGDFDVNVIVCSVCRDRLTPKEETSAPGRSVGTAMTASMEEATEDGVRLCDKCSSQITNVAKDFIDKNVLDPALPTLLSRIPKLAKTPRKTATRPSSMPLGFGNRHALLDSPDEKATKAPRTEALRMTERAEK